jgi:formamidopyrimidine-DNA glycosylase
MPELPEVQTTVNGINTVAKHKKILDIWTDFKSEAKMFSNTIKNPKYCPIAAIGIKTNEINKL